MRAPLVLHPISTPYFSNDSWIPSIHWSCSLGYSRSLSLSVAKPHTLHGSKRDFHFESQSPLLPFLILSRSCLFPCSLLLPWMIFLSVSGFRFGVHRFVLRPYFSSPFPSGVSTSRFPFPQLVRGLHLIFAIPFALDSLHATLLTHVDTFFVSFFSHS